MDFRLYIYFITVVEQATFTKAADVLHISQPSLSAAIKRLEQGVGMTLLERSTRHIKVTEEGNILYHEAKKLVNHYQHVSNEMNRLKREGPLQLQIGLIESSHFWVPKILKSFKRDYPHAQINLHEILSLPDVENALMNFDIHLAITNQFLNSEMIEATPLYQERLVVVLPNGHRLASKRELRFADMEGEAFIVCKEGFQTRKDILHAFGKSGFQPKIQFEIERFETACRLVDEGLGMTILPENYVDQAMNGNYTIRPIVGEDIARHVYLAYEKNRYLPPIVLRYIELIETYFKVNHRITTK
ncbi:LysR family transcriptional regulator [Virgibacillus salexigens]|uniref:LysR family transcriptional regulator n=1 Tax=Virgibacillus salexigens TaxID=61016 RepID=UPI00308171C6